MFALKSVTVAAVGTQALITVSHVKLAGHVCDVFCAKEKDGITNRDKIIKIVDIFFI
ncbi:MAG: hypothetical protein WA057_04420 [Candidatus Magasanikiibacteriota bacterium]